MAADVVRLYISLISQFFTLSDMAVSSPSELSSASSGVSGADFPPFMPQSSNAINDCALSDTYTCGDTGMRVGDGYLEVSSDASSGMKGLLESARWRFENALTVVWLRGASLTIIIRRSVSESSSYHYRCEFVPSPRNLDSGSCSPIHHIVPFANTGIPETSHHRGVQDCRRCRHGIVVELQRVEARQATPHCDKFHIEDC